MGMSTLVRCIACSSKSKKAQAAADKPAVDNTLLGQASLTRHRMMRIQVEPDSYDRIVEIANSPDMQKALRELQGLLALEITKAAEDNVIFTHSRWQDETCMKASEANITELLKPFGKYFASDPERFYAAGGMVQLSGVSLWSYKPAASTEGDVEAKKAVEEQQEPEEPKLVDDVQEPVFKLTEADDEQEQEVPADDADKLGTETNSTKAPARSSGFWGLGLFGMTCCAANN